MIQLEEGLLLTRIHQYRLQRPDGILRIEVHEMLPGPTTKFVAAPVDFIGLTSRRELHIQGDTESEALESLIEKIKTFTFEEIFPKRKEKE